MMRHIFRYFRNKRFSYTPLIEITLSKDNLLYNLNTYKKHNSPADIAPVLKSDAYGHGIIHISKIVDNEKPPFLVVDSYYEALILRNEKVQSPILIIGYTHEDNILSCSLENIIFTITSTEQLKRLAEKLKSPKTFHIKFDTGMCRQGIWHEEKEKALQISQENKNINIEGICSHFADADGEDGQFTEGQINRWNEIVKFFRENLPNLKYRHISATSGSYYTKKIDANVVRLGLGLYGINPNKKLDLALKPVLEMKSFVSGIKKIKRGEKVGYGCTFTAEKDMTLATVPAGYYEGVDRRLSNIGFLKVGNEFCPIIGRISMNITTIDVSHLKEVSLDTPVTLISRNTEDKNSIQSISKINETIPYEILVHIPERIRRKVV